MKIWNKLNFIIRNNEIVETIKLSKFNVNTEIIEIKVWRVNPL